MKRFLFTSILLVRIAYGQPSGTTDTLCFPVPVVQKVLIAAEQKKVLEQQVGVLNKRIAEKDSIIRLLEFMEETNQQVIQTYVEEVKVMQQQRSLFEAQIKQNEKVIKKLKRKVFWSSAAGVVGIGAMTYLLLAK